jgi:predicted phage tail protein
VVTGLTNGTTYRFQVRALNAAGPSDFSALSNRVTPIVVVAAVPDAPTIRNARTGAVGAPLTAIANWRTPRVTGSSPITGYRVTAIPAAGGANIVSGILPVTARDETFEMTLPAGNYRFTVVAINSVGPSAPSAQSNLVAAR